MKIRTMTAQPRIQNKEQGLMELYLEQLRALYSAEQQLVKALPKMSKAASSSELKSAFVEHLQSTQEHVSRLEQIFAELNEKPGRVKCEGMEGLLKEGEETIKKKAEDPAIKDAALIAAAQRIEHYEIAGYGTVRTYAQKLGFDEAVTVLQQTLNEEGDADKTLTFISDNLLAEEEQENQQHQDESDAAI